MVPQGSRVVLDLCPLSFSVPQTAVIMLRCGFGDFKKFVWCFLTCAYMYEPQMMHLCGNIQRLECWLIHMIYIRL
jgi:hypothetical protein